MTKLTIFVGVVLSAIGLAGEHFYGAKLHPLWTGLILIVCGVLASSKSPKQRMLWMHIAVTIGLIGFLVPGIMSIVALVRLHSSGVPTIAPALLHEQMLVALVCLLYVILCVRSFISARRSRTA